MARKPINVPADDDLRHDDENFNPQIEPRKAKAWLNRLDESERAFRDYNDRCDNIDRQYANLARLANMARDKEFQMFWANAEVLKPSIYAKPPVPVVTPKFKDRRPVYQAASEVMERTAIVAFDLVNIDELMKLVRDDLALSDRGIAWCRYEDGKGSGYHGRFEKVCIDFKHRRDFLHSISRNWREVTWVAGASYLTRTEARKRFKPFSGDAYKDAEYRVDHEAKEVGGADRRERAKFWEVWDKTNNRVLWVAKGCEDILDEDDPHLELRNFFPCPKPAYGTVQRSSLVPVPDVLQYKDQLEELNMLTGRVHALSDALEAKGFYPAGGGEIADAVQRAISIKTPGQVLVPISNWAAFGGSKEVIIWMPIDMIATTITGLVALRKQIIEDIYQIMGLSDIMRGATDPQETLGAQQLKTQYGSTRIRDKQQEIVRLARDLVEITTEIVCEKFDVVTIIEMSQTQLPTQAMQRKQIEQIQQQMQNQQFAIQRAIQSPQAQQMAQQNPQQAQQLMQQVQGMLQEGEKAIRKIAEKPSLEQVMALLQNTRAKAFTLDIETDSTIMLDEQMEKKSRTEFIGVMGQMLPQLSQMIAQEPKTAGFAGELLKFATAPFRAGRSLEAAIDELVEQMKAKADGPPPPNPEAEKNKMMHDIEQEKLKIQRDKDKTDADIKREEIQQRAEADDAKLRNDRYIKGMELEASEQDDAARARTANQKAMHDREKHQMDIISKQADIAAGQQKLQLSAAQNQIRAADMQQRQAERRQQQDFNQRQASMKMFMPPAPRRQ